MRSYPAWEQAALSCLLAISRLGLFCFNGNVLAGTLVRVKVVISALYLLAGLLEAPLRKRRRNLSHGVHPIH
jgi:hypothetical protein